MTEVVKPCSSPRCLGKQPKLYVNFEKGVYYCFRCGASGKVTDAPKEPPSPVHDDTIEMPPASFLLSPRSESYLYQKRGLSPFVVAYAGVRETVHGLLFHFPDEVYWQERRWDAFRPPPWRNPKTAPRGKNSGLVYLLACHPGHNRVVLVEGVMDALKVAGVTNAAAVLGNSVHPVQAEELARRFSHAVWMPDADVSMASAGKSFSVLQRTFETSSWAVLNSGDPADCNFEEIERAVL